MLGLPNNLGRAGCKKHEKLDNLPELSVKPNTQLHPGLCAGGSSRTNGSRYPLGARREPEIHGEADITLDHKSEGDMQPGSPPVRLSINRHRLCGSSSSAGGSQSF